MFGKFRNNYKLKIFIVVFVFVPTIISANTNMISTNTTTTNTNKTLFINGYEYDPNNANYTKGLRLQGIGDFFFKSGVYAKALSYYEQALEFLPSEGDITFRMAEIYQYEKLWRLSILYYEQTIKLLQQQINFSKSQQNIYISRIRIANIYHLQGEKNKAIQLLTELRKESSLLSSSYPEAWKELKVFDTIYPETAVRL